MYSLPLIAAILAFGAAHAQTSPSVENPIRLGPGIRTPVVLLRVEPIYTEEAILAKREGVAIISLVVQKDGAATDLRIVRSAGQGLDESAIEAVKQWRFQPAEKDRQPVAVFATVEVAFVLPHWQIESSVCKKPAGTLLIRPSKVEYPPAVENSQLAFVSLSYQVNEQGVPHSIRVDESSDQRWEAPAVAAVTQWRYEPPMQDNRPILFSCRTKLQYR